MRIDEDRQWESSEEDVDCLIEIAKQFMRYLDKIDLSDRAYFTKLFPASANFNTDNQFLKRDSLVLPGSAIFHLLFEGTRVQYLERVTQT